MMNIFTRSFHLLLSGVVGSIWPILLMRKPRPREPNPQACPVLSQWLSRSELPRLSSPDLSFGKPMPEHLHGCQALQKRALKTGTQMLTLTYCLSPPAKGKLTASLQLFPSCSKTAVSSTLAPATLWLFELKRFRCPMAPCASGSHIGQPRP